LPSLRSRGRLLDLIRSTPGKGCVVLDEDDLSLYHYELPPERIAAYPAGRRDQARLLVFERASGQVRHAVFAELPDLLQPGDLVVVNNTSVVPARLQGRRHSGGLVEIVLQPGLAAASTGESAPDRLTGQALLRPSARVRQGEVLKIDPGLEIRVEDPPGTEVRRVSFAGTWEDLWAAGSLPLPPYLRRTESLAEPQDSDRYQTIFAEHPGAVAAPTAGLHFTPEVVKRLEERGIEVQSLTLHVGPGTFLPIRSERLSEHRMHAESFFIPESTATAVERTRTAGGRVVAIGTTTTRALESATEAGQLRPGPGQTELMIRPPYRFCEVDVLLTNFHLPRSTLLAMVSAFAGRQNILNLYTLAAREGYRFYSYGDAMLLQ
jgi:S-adenosylmethionine:tRNA ribosyltransferase-isomerase